METESGDMRTGAEGSGGRPAPQRSTAWLLDVGILVLAALLRLWALDVKPPHFDEGVNGYFVDEMTRRGAYHYDPTNFHGPLHFYILHATQTLFGRDIAVLRAPLALAGAACVAVMLFGFRRWFSAGVSRWAALALAVSPGFVFYARYAIHETWLVLFLMLLVIGVAGWWTSGRRRDLWLACAGLAGALLTKETWVIHVFAMALAVPTLLLLEWVSPSAPLPRARPQFASDEIFVAAVVSVLGVLFFYSGALVDPSGVLGFFEAFMVWTKTGAGGESGHEKPFWYWADLLGRYEWPVLLGVIGAVVVVLPGVNRFLRWLAVGSLGALTGYAIVAYKTPWCLIAWAWPFCLVFGAGVEWLMARVDRWACGLAAAVVLVFSFAHSRALNFHRFANEAEPYVYVQTTLEVEKLLAPLRWQAARDPLTLFHPGHLLQQDHHHPFMWLLAERPNVTFQNYDATPEPLDADWVLIDSSAKDRIEAALQGAYFRESLQIRGMAPDRSLLYLRAESFREYFPDRAPEIVPREL